MINMNEFDFNCSICCEINGKYHVNHSDDYKELIKNKENIVWKSEKFSILASLGPINNSHLLVVPNRHIVAMSLLNNYEFEELILIKEELRSINGKFGKKTEFFEHGCGCDFNSGGACIDHAHLHSIAIDTSIMDKIYNHFNFQKIDFLDITYMHEDKTKGYVYLEDINKQSYIMKEDIVPSQYLRQWYAKALGISDWDWRTNENISLVKETINIYKNKINLFSIR